MRRFIATLLFVSVLPSLGGAQQRDTSAKAAFRRIIQVYDPDTQDGIEGVQVVDRVTGNSVKSSATGHIVLVPDFVKAGGALLVFKKIGYDSVGPLLIDPTADTTLLVPMSRAATRLEKVDVNDRYNVNLDDGQRKGFDARCSVSTVTCYRRDELLAHPAAPLSLFLTKTSGVIGGCGSTFTRGRPTSRPMGTGGRVLDCIKMRGVGVKAGQLCVPTFFVDGFRRGATDQTLDDIEQFMNSTQVTGMEVYMSGEPIPMRFTGDIGCGSVAIWTK